MKLALDTNVLAYAQGVGDAQRCGIATEVIRRLPVEDVVIPVQALAELYNVLTRKVRRPVPVVLRSIQFWRDGFPLVGTTPAVMQGAVDLAAGHSLSIWDAVILAAAAESGCRLLLSEDLQDGFTWHGVTVTNPFSAKLHPLLESALQA